jgi:hypothetical protein
VLLIILTLIYDFRSLAAAQEKTNKLKQEFGRYSMPHWLQNVTKLYEFFPLKLSKRCTSFSLREQTEKIGTQRARVTIAV